MTAMDTLCSQAFGASQASKMGTYSLTGMTVTAVVFLLSGVLVWHASSILIALGQPVEVSSLAGDFIRLLVAGRPIHQHLQADTKSVTIQERGEAYADNGCGVQCG
jgi:Na+-driven multidrug efflux pump